jgi:Mitochondrial K+-H+ exchange-related
VHPSWVGNGDVTAIIEEIVQRRKPIHQRSRWRWALVIPLVSPLSLVPGIHSWINSLMLVLPNFPFFYAAYRCWSHHRGCPSIDVVNGSIEGSGIS